MLLTLKLILSNLEIGLLAENFPLKEPKDNLSHISKIKPFLAHISFRFSFQFHGQSLVPNSGGYEMSTKSDLRVAH